MNWKESSIKPKEKFGWFAVAVLPLNHSGNEHETKTDLEGDNDWRKNFGFTKAWLNNGKWYEPDATGFRTRNITNLVTHWDYLPEVPVLEKTFYGGKDDFMSTKMTKKQIKEVAEKEWAKIKEEVNYKDFEKGFLASFEFMGFR